MIVAHGHDGKFYNDTNNVDIAESINTFFTSKNLRCANHSNIFRFQVCTGQRFIDRISLPGGNNRWNRAAPSKDSFVRRDGYYLDLDNNFDLEAFIPLYLFETNAWTDEMKIKIQQTINHRSDLTNDIKSQTLAQRKNKLNTIFSPQQI